MGFDMAFLGLKRRPRKTSVGFALLNPRDFDMASFGLKGKAMSTHPWVLLCRTHGVLSWPPLGCREGHVTNP
eukprot:9440234-Pyramimonas_sp.AAC.1